MAKPKEREQNFETSLATLEQIVGQLESGELPLERSLELFEEGVALARRCQLQLQDAERKVELLLRERGEVKVVPFETTVLNEPAVNTKQEQKLEDKPDDSIPF
ncbi:MAG: exodeoxyribonuclease VII small subunit [Acidobacteria bacterium]|nr:exodeoxyribonuclease VII small subunit [Acidobacteriota bacterium]